MAREAVAITIGERSFTIAPYKLGSLRKCAAYLDRINARGDVDNLEATLEGARDMCEVLAIGTVKLDPTCDADWIEEQYEADEVPLLMEEFRKVLLASGLAKGKPGEVKAGSEPVAPEPESQREAAAELESSSAG